MRSANWLVRRNSSSAATLNLELLSTADLRLHRDAVIRNMVEAIAARNSIAARRHSYEEIRLTKLLISSGPGNADQQ